MQNTGNISVQSIEFRSAAPPAQLEDFVESFWTLHNTSANAHDTVGLPDGRFDIIFSRLPGGPLRAVLIGLGTAPEPHTIPAGILMCAISFKLLAIEYLLDIKAASILNTASVLPEGFWNVSEGDMGDFEGFCRRATNHMLSLVKQDIDSRKQKLFELIYSSNGSMPVSELSARVFWSSRQINRYFNEHFGISLKTYCSILRFRASLPHIKQGRLYPDLNFADQNHFIKEVKKFSGVAPGELLKNQNDRFILLSAMPGK